MRFGKHAVLRFQRRQPLPSFANLAKYLKIVKRTADAVAYGVAWTCPVFVERFGIGSV